MSDMQGAIDEKHGDAAYRKDLKEKIRKIEEKYTKGGNEDSGLDKKIANKKKQIEKQKDPKKKKKLKAQLNELTSKAKKAQKDKK